jgi:hypothetical protein
MRQQIIFITALLMVIGRGSFAQERCATVQVEELRHQKNPRLETDQQFENWLQQKIAQRPMQMQRAQGTANVTYSIPVVVHVIHNGEPIGTGLNISDAQIISQINVMNKDFQRMNLDATNTPAEFAAVAGSIDIEFVLAKQDPFGAATNGIQRVQGTKSVWTITDNATFKALSYWPAEDYFNIWVINIPSFLGYAQLPVSNLPGLENSPDDRLTDGILTHYQVFGSNFEGLGTFNLDSDYDRGRTATHEAGHFFGLRHIWGDDGSSCSGTDHVDDTPNQAGNYVGQCPTQPRVSCSSNDMFQNYMDYTDDACMNIFTQGQIARMIVVLENSPRRFSLLNSDGDEPPPALALDLALRTINSPALTTCGGSITPVIEIQNLGTTPATSARIQLKINSVITETKDVSLSLANQAITTVTFQPVLQTSGTVQYQFEVLLVNGSTDQRATNNTLSVTSTVPATATLPIIESFTSFPSTWTRYNPDNSIKWEIKTIAGYGNAMYVNCYNYENEGAIDRMITPVIDLTNETAGILKFDRAHAVYSSTNQERLRVLVSTLCDFNAPTTEVFNKAGSELATAPQTTSQFVPTPAQWQTESISLSQFAGTKIQIAFEVVNGWGNDVFLDNVIVLTDELVDLAIVAVESPGPVTCVTNPAPVIRVKNLGSTTITSFVVQAVVNNQSQALQTISGISLAAGGEQTVTLNPLPLTIGNNNIRFTVSEPSGLPDANASNNAITIKRIVNTFADRIPLRENFNQDFLDQWTIISQNNEATWIPFATNAGYSVAYNSYLNTKKGEESWLVSPVLDFSNTSKASLFFDVSYAKSTLGNERLRLLYSEDCGQSYPFVLYDQAGSSLSTVTSNSPWIPSQEQDWRREFINLNNLAGKDQVRFAFVANNDNGNNLFIDNVEFFIDDNPFPVSINTLFSVYGVASEVKLTFNLEEKLPVLLAIYNMQGQEILQNQLPETLNQTYTFDLGLQGSGIYIVKVQIGYKVGATKVFISGN